MCKLLRKYIYFCFLKKYDTRKPLVVMAATNSMSEYTLITLAFILRRFFENRMEVGMLVNNVNASSVFLKNWAILMNADVVSLHNSKMWYLKYNRSKYWWSRKRHETHIITKELLKLNVVKDEKRNEEKYLEKWRLQWPECSINLCWEQEGASSNYQLANKPTCTPIPHLPTISNNIRIVS